MPPPRPAERATIQVLRGTDAESLLFSPRFLQRWRALHEQCLWATVFQSSDFVLPWYETYRGAREPLVLIAESSNGDLVGLLTLAIGDDETQIEPAGGHHAEYQVWLATPQWGDRFIAEACAELRARFRRGRLRFHFLPPGAPLRWTAESESRGFVETHGNSRGLMPLGDGLSVEASIRKKSNRSRMQRLERHGAVRFERITTLAELDAVFDQIIQFCDLRQGATRDVLPFCSDARKREFYRAMMRVPGLLHATVLRVGDTLVAAHIGLCDGRRVILGLPVYSPFFAAHSPGKLLMLLLGQMLVAQGFTTLDLTPGGAYKERFATDSEDVRVLTCFPRQRDRLEYAAIRALTRAALRALRALRVDPEHARARGANWLNRVRHLRPGSLPAKLWRRARRLAGHTVESRIYVLPVARIASLANAGVLRKDDLQALLAYRAGEGMTSLQEFLHEAVSRLGEGQHVYSVVRDGLLVHYVWLAERQERARLALVDQELQLPPDTAVVFDAVTHPSARGKGIYRAALSQLLHEAAAVPGTRQICACMLSDIGATRHLITEFGFVYQGSFFRRTRFGRSRVWSTMPPTWPDAITLDTLPG